MAVHQASLYPGRTQLPLRRHHRQRQTLHRVVAASTLHPDGRRSICSGELDLSLSHLDTLIEGPADTLFHRFAMM